MPFMPHPMMGGPGPPFMPPPPPPMMGMGMGMGSRPPPWMPNGRRGIFDGGMYGMPGMSPFGGMNTMGPMGYPPPRMFDRFDPYDDLYDEWDDEDDDEGIFTREHRRARRWPRYGRGRFY